MSALDGVSGLERGLSENVDLVVLDLMLPGRSGLEVLAELHGAKPGLPVIILTARGEVEDRVAGLDAGAIDYLTKPFSLSELAARIRAQLRVAVADAGDDAQSGRHRGQPADSGGAPRGRARPPLDDRVRAARST